MLHNALVALALAFADEPFNDFVAEPIGAKATPMPHIDPKYDEMTWFHPPAEIAPQPNNLTKTFEATCRLLMTARRIMDVM